MGEEASTCHLSLTTGVNVSRLEVTGIVKTLGPAATPQASAVLRNVTFSMVSGECLGLKGATGSGKSTLLRIIAGLMPPDAGEVRLDDEVLSTPKILVPPAERGIGMVFQNLGLWPHLNVRGHLDFVLSALPLTRTEREQRVDEALERFLLRGLEWRYPAELSGGEKHLLAIARALIANVKLLLLDEPFNGLDTALKERILERLKSERERRRLTTLLVTHDDDEMRLLCTRVEQMSEGRIIERVMAKG
jgi:iron(III) transport system ATP-binding protein